ncbi:CocE/NonD family hydrolase C-terminal non-catalytic domain-containing protein, partial [Rhizobium ruizarguesonis]
RFRKGHRIRLSLSTAYWPMILPPPYDEGIEVDIAALGLGLPMLGEHQRIDIKEPANPYPLPKYIEHEADRNPLAWHQRLGICI